MATSFSVVVESVYTRDYSVMIMWTVTMEAMKMWICAVSGAESKSSQSLTNLSEKS